MPNCTTQLRSDFQIFFGPMALPFLKQLSERCANFVETKAFALPMTLGLRQELLTRGTIFGKRFTPAGVTSGSEHLPVAKMTFLCCSSRRLT